MGVVVPTLQEARALPRLLERLAWMPVHDVVVADAGSTDGTPELARRAGARVLTDLPRGRAGQLNAGAAHVHGDVLWFLHADALPPVDAVACIRRALSTGAHEAGAFLLHTMPERAGRAWGPLLRIADVRSRWTRYPYGDQGLFVRRSAFDAVGGFPRQALLEDVALSRLLAKRAPIARVTSEMQVSGRRFEARPLYYFAVMNSFPTLARLGVPLDRLASWYAHER